MKKIKLSNGVEMPQLGYGVYQVEPDECERCVVDALSVGYRMIDTAQAYLNEEAVGNAWKKSGVNRDEIFLVSKVWPSNYGNGQTMKSIDESLRKLQTDHIDLMLLHQPYCDRYGAYRALKKDLIVQCIEEKKRHKSVGVKIVKYHKSPLLIETHDMATEAMAKTRKEFHQKTNECFGAFSGH